MILLGLASTIALGDFGNALYARLTEGRIVVIAGANRFVLLRDAAWMLADESQAPAFKKWREGAGLPADLGQFVADLPKDREVPYLGSVQVEDVSDTKKVTFDLEGKPKVIALKAVQGGWRPDNPGKKVFEALAKDLGASPSTLAVNLAGGGEGLSEERAWQKFVDRFKSKDFYIEVGKQRGLFWARARPPVDSAPPTTEPGPVGGSGTDLPDDAEPPSGGSEAPNTLWMWVIGGLLLATNITLATILVRKRGVPVQSASRQEPASERVKVSHHERQLLEKVREEQTRMDLDAQSRAGAEELVVGKMIEAYDQFDKLKAERADLIKYKQYQESFETFDAQARKIKRQSDERQREVRELAAQLRREQANLADLQKELERAKNTIESLESDLKSAERLLDDVNLWQRDFDNRLQKVASQLRDE